MSDQERYPCDSSAAFKLQCLILEARYKAYLFTFALITACISGVGLFREIDTPSIDDALLCAVLAFALFLYASAFWAGAWHLADMLHKNSMRVCSIIAVFGFVFYGAVSITANLSATNGEASLSLVQQGMTDEIEQAEQAAGAYVGQMRITRAGVAEQADLARRSEQDEIAGRGPTGIPGRGSVSNSYAAAAVRYDQAVALIDGVLSQTDAHLEALQTMIAEMRSLQIDVELRSQEKGARLRVLSGQALSELRKLLALDPARTIRAAAGDIAAGVPNRSDTNAASQVRIEEISDAMRAYAARLDTEADRIADLAPAIPELTTLSTSERLWQTVLRTPAWTALALLLDFVGWLCVLFRVAMRKEYRAREAAEEADTRPMYITTADIWRYEGLSERILDSMRRIEELKAAPKRGRPKGSKNKPKDQGGMPEDSSDD